MKKNIFGLVIFLLGLSCTIVSFNFPKQEKGFKNLKVLSKKIDKKQLDSTMDYFCISLGVHCGFCHARDKDSTKKHLDFASDEKPEKNRARDMIRMTSLLNSRYFNPTHESHADMLKTVTCYTCHRGSKEPDYKNLLDQYKVLESERKRK